MWSKATCYRSRRESRAQLLPHVAAETGNSNYTAIYSTVHNEVRAALTEASEFDVKQITARNATRQDAAEQTSLNGDDED